MRAACALRSLAFAALSVVWSVGLAIAYLPLLVVARARMQAAARLWIRGELALLALCCRLRHRIEGREHLPSGAFVIAAKHQSAWDTLIFHLLLADPIYVVKKELFAVPLFGWHLRKAGNIGIARKAGFRALKTMLPAVAQRLGEGAQVIIFPEGTRVGIGARVPYQPGIAAIYARTAVPVVPVALNSGLFWGRRSFLKRPGVITLEILPAMPTGLGRERFLATLAERIESASTKLVEEAANADTLGALPVVPEPMTMGVDPSGKA